MIRSAFFSIGLFVVLCGSLFLVTERLVLAEGTQAPAEMPVLKQFLTTNSNDQYELIPPDWMPFTFLACGAVTMLYSLALPRKQTKT